MSTILGKIFGREEKPQRISEHFDAETIKPFFTSLGVDIDTIGFPKLGNDGRYPSDPYHTTFSQVYAFPVEIDSSGPRRSVKTVVSGDYIIAARAGSKKSGGIWLPGGDIRYSFRIEDGKLNIVEKEI